MWNEFVCQYSDRYMTMIQQFFLPALQENDLDNAWLQDVATAHTSRVSMGILRATFPECLNSLRGNINWPACSPDLSPPDYCLWAYLESLVYKDRSKTLEDLRNHIQAEIDNILS
ncbi:DUF4817 domain-containing protein [Trichonephila clavipes]|nr:DUF4817 domain-containing protein [Trichonephila clavipes]